MKWSAATVSGLVASAVANQGAAVTGIVKPDSAPPAGCSASRDGKFQVSIYSLNNAKRDLQKRECGGEGTLIMTLTDGVLKDAKDRTGYIASNFQFQFDGPPQAGAIYTAGFSTCGNGSLALGGSTVFYRCLSGDFYNLYDRHWAAQCEPIEIVAASCDRVNNPGNGNKAASSTLVPTTIITQIGDGQPQARTTLVPVPVSQISDGQPQGPILAPPVSQISDGQIQAPTTVPPPVSQITDGQPQAPIYTAAPAPPAVSQISDGQPQAPTQTAPVVSQIPDGQPQAPNKTAPIITKPTTVPTNAAERILPGIAAAAVAVAGVFVL